MKMKKIRETSSNPDTDKHLAKIGEHFPLDILLIHILVRLPAKSVVCCMCVCKEWYDSIRKPSIIDFYFKNSHLYADTYLIYAGENSFGLVSCKTFDVVSNYKFPSEKFSHTPVQIVGSANGFLCLFSFDITYEPIYLMNPSIGKFKVIKSSAIAHRTIGIDTRVILGFGHHQKSGDYKIVRFIERQQVHGGRFGESYVEIYSLRTDAWKEIKVDCFPWMIRDEASSVMLNEHIHWIAHNWNLEDSVVLSFNVEKDVLDEVQLPDLGVQLKGTLTKSAVVLMDCLCLFVYILPVGSAESTHCSLWIMKDYGLAESWAKLYNIEFHVSIRRCISYTEHDQIILEDISENILLYNVVTGNIDHLNIPEKPFLVKLAPYKESLFLLNRKNEILEIQSSSTEHTREAISSSDVEQEDSDKDSDDLELFSEEYSSDEPSEEDSFETSAEDHSESFDEEPSDQVHNCSLQEGDRRECKFRDKSLNLLNERSEKDGQLSEETSSKDVNSLANEGSSSDCIPKTDKTS